MKFISSLIRSAWYKLNDLTRLLPGLAGKNEQGNYMQIEDYERHFS